MASSSFVSSVERQPVYPNIDADDVAYTNAAFGVLVEIQNSGGTIDLPAQVEQYCTKSRVKEEGKEKVTQAFERAISVINTMNRAQLQRVVTEGFLGMDLWLARQNLFTSSKTEQAIAYQTHHAKIDGLNARTVRIAYDILEGTNGDLIKVLQRFEKFCSDHGITDEQEREIVFNTFEAANEIVHIVKTFPIDVRVNVDQLIDTKIQLEEVKKSLKNLPRKEGVAAISDERLMSLAFVSLKQSPKMVVQDFIKSTSCDKEEVARVRNAFEHASALVLFQEKNPALIALSPGELEEKFDLLNPDDKFMKIAFECLQSGEVAWQEAAKEFVKKTGISDEYTVEDILSAFEFVDFQKKNPDLVKSYSPDELREILHLQQIGFAGSSMTHLSEVLDFFAKVREAGYSAEAFAEFGQKINLGELPSSPLARTFLALVLNAEMIAFARTHERDRYDRMLFFRPEISKLTDTDFKQIPILGSVEVEKLIVSLSESKQGLPAFHNDAHKEVEKEVAITTKFPDNELRVTNQFFLDMGRSGMVMLIDESSSSSKVYCGKELSDSQSFFADFVKFVNRDQELIYWLGEMITQTTRSMGPEWIQTVLDRQTGVPGLKGIIPVQGDTHMTAVRKMDANTFRIEHDLNLKLLNPIEGEFSSRKPSCRISFVLEAAAASEEQASPVASSIAEAGKKKTSWHVSQPVWQSLPPGSFDAPDPDDLNDPKHATYQGMDKIYAKEAVAPAVSEGASPKASEEIYT